MKKFIVIICCVFGLTYLYGQEIFTIKIRTEYTDDVSDVIEVDDAYYTTFTSFTYDTVYSYIRKFGNTSDSLNQIRLCKDSLKVICSNLLPLNNGNVVLFGYSKNKNDGYYSIIMYELNPELEIIKSDRFKTPFIQIGLTDLIVDGSSFIFSGTYTVDNIPHVFIYRTNQNYQLIGSNTFDDYYKYCFSSAIDPTTSNIKLAVWGDVVNGTSGNFYVIDTSLQLIKIDTLPNRLWSYYEIRYIDSSTYYLSGKDVTEGADDNYRIMLMDTSSHIYKEVTFGAIDTFDYPGLNRNMSFLQPNRVYCGLTRNIAEQIPIYSTNKSWYGVYLLDDSLNILWKRFYGGDAYYMLRVIEATTDGGCLLAGRRYDYLTQDMEFDIVIVKMDSTGLITSTGPGPEMQAHDAIVYPNPGSNVINIESGPQIYGAWFSLYDLAGKLLERKQLNGQKETLQTSGLPNGVYLWNIVFKGKTLEGGKWVKTD